MSEKIGLARAKIVDLLSLILRTHSRDELFSLFRSAEGITPKADPESWREENRKKQAAGVRFDKLADHRHGWIVGKQWDFNEGSKEDYREVPQDKSKERFEELVNEAISVSKLLEKSKFYPEQSKEYAERLLKEIPHAAERALWKAQRDAGTNEVWQVLSGNSVADIRINVEPNWHPRFIYRVKPMKLTAKIRRSGMGRATQEWQFLGTREEYLAECEKYGYFVVSEIKEVKTTVKYYFALMKNSAGEISVEWCDESNLSTLEKMGNGWSGHTIIGDIEEREVEV